MMTTTLALEIPVIRKTLETVIHLCTVNSRGNIVVIALYGRAARRRSDTYGQRDWHYQ